MIDNAQFEKIQDELFKDPSLNVYAVIDGAAVKDLRFKLWEMQPEYCCLWAGKLEPDMEEVAPYLVSIERNTEFLSWLILNGWGNSWNIFIINNLRLREVRKNFRKFLTVKGPSSEPLIFRFYDPRVFRDAVGIMDESQYNFFNGVKYFVSEGPRDSADMFKFFRCDEGLEVAKFCIGA